IQEHRVDVARKFSTEHKCVVVLKGWHTVISDARGTAWVNTTGNPGMATAGSGDILTGIIAGMIGQGVRAFDRTSKKMTIQDAQKAQKSYEAQLLLYVLAAVYLHGLAGDLARDMLGEHSLIATDLLRFLPQAFQETRDR